MKRGQAELIIIIGLFAVLALVAYFTYQSGIFVSSAVPESIKAEQEQVKNSVLNLARTGASRVIEITEAHGGYLNLSLLAGDYDFEPGFDYTVFMQTKVPYWQKCQNDISPTKALAKRNIESGLEFYLKKNLNDTLAVYGENITYDLENLDVKATILNDKIDFEVDLPTTVQDYEIEQPYAFSIPSKFGDIFDFAKDFASASASKRFLESFTINTIYSSNTLKTSGVLTECGDSIYLSTDDIKNGLYGAIEYTLANILWWQEMPAAGSGFKVYAIEDLNGKKYPHLSPIRFYLPDGFKPSASAPVIVTNNEYIIDYLIFVLPACIKAYNLKYTVSYPVIIRINDQLTGHGFNFASLVFVDNMTKGECTAAGIVPGPSACENLACSANIAVVDGNNNALENVSVFFGGCLIGKTGDNGVVEGSIACGEQIFMMQKPGYELYMQTLSSSSVNGTYKLHKIPELTIKFADVLITENSSTFSLPDGNITNINYRKCTVNTATETVFTNLSSTENPGRHYMLTNINSSSVPEGCSNNPACESCYADPANNNDDCIACSRLCTANITDSVTVDYITAGNYDIECEIWDTENYIVKGGFKSNYNLPEQDSNLYFYIPRGIDDASAAESEKIEITERLRNWCSMEPVSVAEQKNTIGITGVCGCHELRGLIDKEFLSCMGSMNDLFDSNWNCNRDNVLSEIYSRCGYRVLGC